jgi:hypothetical protein
MMEKNMITIHPYKEKDWQSVCAIHDAVAQMN